MKRNLFFFIVTSLSVLSSVCFSQITVTFPSDRAIFQRNNTNEATVYVGGYYTNAFTSIQAKFTPIVSGEGEDTGWQPIQNKSTGNYYGSVLVKGGWYKLEVRGVKSGEADVIAQIDHVGVGEVFVVAGQSNATGGDGNPNGPEAAHDQVNSVNYQNYDGSSDPTIKPYSDIKLPFPKYIHLDKDVKTAPFGNYAWCWGAFGDKIYEKLRVPVMIFNGGWSSTDISNWQETINPSGITISPFGYQFPAGLPFGHLRAALNNYTAQLGVRAVLWHQGESDNFVEHKNEVPSTDWYARYLNGLWTVIQGSRNISGKDNLAWVVARASRFDFPRNVPERQTTVSANVINAQNEIINNNTSYPHVYQGPDTDPYYDLNYRADEVHFRGDGVTEYPNPDGPGTVVYSGLVDLAGFWADQITPTFLSESVPYPASAPPHVTIEQSSGSTSVTFTAPGDSQIQQFNWFTTSITGDPDNSNSFVNNDQVWTTGPGLFQIKIVDQNSNTVISPKLFVSSSAPLPVTWKYFTGETTQYNRPLLKWATTSETSALNFEVERSIDAKTFNKVSSVTAAGDSRSLNEYRFQDEALPAGDYYYRLKQLDFDGKFEFSRIVNIKIGLTGLVKIYPNPVTDKLNIESEKTLGLVELINLSGKKLYAANYQGRYFELEMSKFPSGLYTVKVNGESFKIVK